MVTTMLMAVLALMPPVQTTDTIVAVERGERLEVDNFTGDVVVRSWDRDAVRIRADLSDRQRYEVVRTGSALRVRPRASQRGPGDIDFEIEVPRWMSVRVDANRGDIDIRGTVGEVAVETVAGDVVVDGGAGILSLRSIQGEIVLRNARGRIEVIGVNEDIGLTDVTGELHAETTNGDIAMRGIRSATARARTLNGDILYEGTLEDGGRYVLGTHNGDVLVAVPVGTGATVSVGTYQGNFRSDFPVSLTGTTRDRHFTFTLGSGGAHLDLESFNGEIHLKRP